ncbi:MAG: TonB-dependent receptor plug domain-containing protein [Aliidongia sp.]
MFRRLSARIPTSRSTPLRTSTAILALLPALAASGAWAQTAPAASSDSNPEEITVTGKRLEETLPQILEQQGTRIDVVSAEDIAKGGYLDIAQSLQTTVPGLYISPKNGPFDYVDISLQGSRTEDVLWLIDGIRINNRLYGGTTPLDTLPATIVDRIEVLEGGESLFYGTQAVSGAINVVTKGFSDTPEGGVQPRRRHQYQRPCRRLLQRFDWPQPFRDLRRRRHLGRLPALPQPGLPAEQHRSRPRL